MEDYIVETETIGKYRIDIIQDTDPESPRTWDNLGTMVCFHSRHDLGDKHNYNHKDYNGWDEMEMDIIKQENVGVILPLYLYEHSGKTMNTTGFSCGFDSGQVGFIFISKEKIREEYGVKRITQKVRDRVEKLLVGEVETYDQYLTGDIYGYRITDTETDEELDSCWGFYGSDYCMTEVKGIVGYYLEKDKPEESEEYYTGLLYGVDNNQ
jgi:hypothetical protein